MMVSSNDIDGLREVMRDLSKIKIVEDYELTFIDEVNIVKG